MCNLDTISFKLFDHSYYNIFYFMRARDYWIFVQNQSMKKNRQVNRACIIRILKYVLYLCLPNCGVNTHTYKKCIVSFTKNIYGPISGKRVK